MPSLQLPEGLRSDAALKVKLYRPGVQQALSNCTLDDDTTLSDIATEVGLGEMRREGPSEGHLSG